MDYEKKYKEALDNFKKIKAANKDNKELVNFIEYEYPELKKSEDGRIIDAIKHGLKCLGWEHINGIRIVDIVAWLEKQGEKKPTQPKWKYKKDNTPLLRDSIILNKYGCVAKSPSGSIISDIWVLDYDELAKLPKEEIENQVEQKESLCDKCRKEQPSHSCQDITELGRCALEHEQKSAWSEEDKEQLDRAIYMIGQLGLTKSWDDVYNWLKSLKDRILI